MSPAVQLAINELNGGAIPTIHTNLATANTRVINSGDPLSEDGIEGPRRHHVLDRRKQDRDRDDHADTQNPIKEGFLALHRQPRSSTGVFDNRQSQSTTLASLSTDRDEEAQIRRMTL
ncbi:MULTISPECIES: hypothetical protein [unclassified Ensifer]|uniref:hypothetical protein n=1 Tax=unclassified Ensifer TaxID=2633371 RepID=UPI0030105EB8